MSNDTDKLNAKPAVVADPLTELLRQGAKELISQAVETELSLLLSEHSNTQLADGRAAIVRNGYLPERVIQTGIGDVEVKVPKVRDRSGSGIKFNSNLLPPYLKRTTSIEELIPWLYLRGISTGDFSEALYALLGDGAKKVSANLVCRLKSSWHEEYKSWSHADLSSKEYVYWWADGIHSNVRMDDRVCMLVIIGVTATGEKELVAVSDGYRESIASWEELLTDLRLRGLTTAPKLATGDGALGFWKAISKLYPETAHQRCWVHKTANVLDKLPKSMQGKVKSALHDIYEAETKKAANKAFDATIRRFEKKYSRAMTCLKKDREVLLAFYDFPAEHWVHIRTTNPIESAFATVRLRTKRSKNCGSRETTLSMIFKLLQSAQKRWRKIKGFKLLPLVANDVPFKDGERVVEQEDGVAA